MIFADNIAEYKEVPTINIDIEKEDREDGSVVLRSRVPLQPHPYRLTERFMHWATHTPGNIFIGRKNASGPWETLTYAQAFTKVRSIAQALLNRSLFPEKPIAILSENSIEHALLSIAAFHVGIPFSSIAPAYSLRSQDFNKLRYVIESLTPGLIFVSDTKKYEAALKAVANKIEVVAVTNSSNNMPATFFEAFETTEATADVEAAYDAIQPQTIAKILFTSGSTGQPKGVINTHENITTNWQQITQTFPFLQNEGGEFIDWLPWNHTFGSNHNLGLAMFNGSAFYIDDGNPTPQGILTTVASLRERNPTVYFNVPKGFEDLLPFFRKDETLRKRFFSKLDMLFYAGAGMPQHVWDAWEELAMETTGKKILIGTGLGCTESSPSALFSSDVGGFAGLLGVPVPGMELKLVSSDGKFEARYRGKNIFPGYWRQPGLTASAFDEEGFYRTGDALRFYDKEDVNKGLLFDGRFAEDFKLSSGTWVRASMLRMRLIAAGNGLIQDVVITGHDKDFIGAIIFPSLKHCREITGAVDNPERVTTINHPSIKEALKNILTGFLKAATGSANAVRRAVIADFDLSIDKGEITDKGTINQRNVIQHHPDVVAKIYAAKAVDDVIEASDFYKSNF